MAETKSGIERSIDVSQQVLRLLRDALLGLLVIMLIAFPSLLSKHLTKAGIIRLAVELRVDMALTHSCYDPDASGRTCGACDSCVSG